MTDEAIPFPEPTAADLLPDADPGLIAALDSLNADLFPPDPYDAALAAARAGCCAERRKPCPYHEGWADGYEQCQADNWRPSESDRQVMAGWEADGTLPSVTSRDIQHLGHDLRGDR